MIVMAKLKNRVYAFSMTRISEPSIILQTGVVVAVTKIVASNLVQEQCKFTEPKDILLQVKRVKIGKAKLITNIGIWVKPKQKPTHEKSVNLG